MTTQKELEEQEAKNELLEIVQRGDTVYCVLRHVSRSGMYRCIDLMVIKDNSPRRISWQAAKLLWGYDKNHEGVKASGCGMDMGFHCVYSLSHMLFGDGYALNHRWL